MLHGNWQWHRNCTWSTFSRCAPHLMFIEVSLWIKSIAVSTHCKLFFRCVCLSQLTKQWVSPLANSCFVCPENSDFLQVLHFCPAHPLEENVCPWPFFRLTFCENMLAEITVEYSTERAWSFRLLSSASNFCIKIQHTKSLLSVRVKIKETKKHNFKHP